MGFFSNNQKTCPICNKQTPRLLAVKIQNMPLCKECANKIDLPDGMADQMTLESFRQYVNFYDANQGLRKTFSETYRFSFGFFGGTMILDASNRLFRLNAADNSLVMEASNLKSFRILEDNAALFEGENGMLKCYRSDVPARANAMAPQIAQFLMQQQMLKQMGRIQEQRAGGGNGESTAPVYNSGAYFDLPAPFQNFYVELKLAHPYWGEFREKRKAPEFMQYDPSVDSYLRDYQEEVDKLHTLAVNLIRLMDPHAQEVSITDSALEAAQAAARADAADPVEEIKRYKNLLDCGVITEEEFTAKKRRLLGI